MANSSKRFTENFDYLIALITHLANTPHKSRTLGRIATDLRLDRSRVQAVLDGFPGFFRKSRRAHSTYGHYYTVHARYARRTKGVPAAPIPPLDPAELATMLDLVATMVQHEAQVEDLGAKRGTIRATLIAAVVAAVASIVAALVKASR